ncbi:hypothetical protein Mal15_21390 [Stieleria maiorica]|uniref:Uncharacterized protein n=1 Tax=Stieleria maiorica TaxID=2795974 RepID=A0A5B9MA47_9BACT|nr:hypothetical protein [Stieleria maiorica]QEF98092.1 hypothetical protein Mal15_21390 [Stieleria maiorica]
MSFNREQLIGVWKSTGMGTDLDALHPLPDWVTTLRPDGTYSCLVNGRDDAEGSPFHQTWELRDSGDSREFTDFFGLKPGHTLVDLTMAIAPIPEFQIDEWTRDRMLYQIIELTDTKMLLRILNHTYERPAYQRFERISNQLDI